VVAPEGAGESAHGRAVEPGGGAHRAVAADATRLLDGVPMHAVVDTVEFY
jgi:hypothetical protein